MKKWGKSLRISIGVLAIPVVGACFFLIRSATTQTSPIPRPTYQWSDVPVDTIAWTTFRQSDLGQHSFAALPNPAAKITDEQLTLLGQWIGKAQFIGLGAVSQGSKENLELQNRLVQYLIQAENVKGVVQEAPNVDFLGWLKTYNQGKLPNEQVKLLQNAPFSYENIKQFAGQVTGPVVIVAHNDHVQRHDLLHRNTEPIGCLLDKNESGNYVSVGSVLFEGAVRVNRNDTLRTIVLPPATPVCAEHFLSKLGESAFLLNTISARQSPFFERVLTDTVATRNLNDAYLTDNQGQKECITMFDKQYDILLFFRTSSALTETR